MDAVEEVKSRLSIEDVIGEYVQLKRSGRNYKGLSPFTNEKTPSFMVSPEKQIWHDFSSGRGGDVFTFVMEAEGLDFKAALELLARKAGVDLNQYRGGRSGQSAQQKERLFAALELATKFYQVQFSKNQTALEYVFKQRGFSKQVALDFQLGYSPNTGRALVDYLKKQKFTDAELQAAGLATRRYQRTNDMFRGRLMIPLADGQGRVVGFTARLLDDQPNAPKYINTPQTILYDKSRHVYGLHLAKNAIRKSGFVVVVEGNLDVLSSHQAGISQVVATAGTAMTQMHLKALNRFAGDVRLAFDDDRAGRSATERVIPIGGKVGVSLSMINLPAGKDPDELIKKDAKLWQQAIDRPQDALEWLIDQYQSELDLSTAAGKQRFSDVLLAVIRQLPDSVVQEHYLQKVAGVIDVSQEALKSKLQQVAQAKTNKAKPKKPVQSAVDTSLEDTERRKVQNRLLGIALLQPDLRHNLKFINPQMLVDEPARELYQFLMAKPDFVGQKESLGQLQKIANYVKMVSLQYEALYQDIEDIELAYEAARLQVRLIEQYVKTEKQSLAQQLRDSDEKTTKVLLERVKALDTLLRQAKEVSHGR